jgi:hypothetical protein
VGNEPRFPRNGERGNDASALVNGTSPDYERGFFLLPPPPPTPASPVPSLRARDYLSRVLRINRVRAISRRGRISIGQISLREVREEIREETRRRKRPESERKSNGKEKTEGRAGSPWMLELHLHVRIVDEEETEMGR